MQSRSDAADWASATSTERNNAQLLDDGANQGLSAADIVALRSGGASGADVIAALEAASATFAGKTEFSQVSRAAVPANQLREVNSLGHAFTLA